MNPELRQSLGAGRVPFVVVGVVLSAFMLIPIAIVVPTSWTAGQLLEFPPTGFSLQWYRAALSDSAWTDAALVSLKVSLQASILATVLGTATALGMRRLVAGRSVRVMRSLFILPLALPYVSYALGMYRMFLSLPGALTDTTLPLVLAQATVTFPLIYVIVAGALATVDPNLARAASTLGARWPSVLWRIELPLIRVAIIGAWVISFAICFDEATLAIFLSPVDQVTLAQQLFREASETIAPTLSAVSTMITLLAIIVLGFGSLLMRRVGKAGGSA